MCSAILAFWSARRALCCIERRRISSRLFIRSKVHNRHSEVLNESKVIVTSLNVYCRDEMNEWNGAEIGTRL